MTVWLGAFFPMQGLASTRKERFNETRVAKCLFGRANPDRNANKHPVVANQKWADRVTLCGRPKPDLVREVRRCGVASLKQTLADGAAFSTVQRSASRDRV